MSVFLEKGEKKRVKVRKKKGGGKKTRNATIGFWPWASPPLKRLRKLQEGVCVSLSCPVCVCVCGANVCQLMCVAVT